MNIEALKTELLAGHPDTGAYSATNATAASQINAVNRSSLGVMSMTELREWAAVNARAFNLRVAISDTNLTDQVRNLAVIGDSLMGTDSGQLDPGNSIHVGMVNELVTAGVWSAADRTALVAKATDDFSRAVEISIVGAGETVGENHIELARRS